MMKRISALVLVLGLAFTSALGCFAADGSDVTVTYNGSSLGYTVNNSENSMQNLRPGVESSYSFNLVNNSSASTNFYMSTEVLQTLTSEKSTKDTGYLVTLLAGDQVIFGNNVADPDSATTRAANDEEGILVGGQGTQELKVLNEDDVLGTNYILVSTVDPNSSTTLTLKITPNATGTDEAYLASTGEMQFQFMAEEVTPLTRTDVTTIRNEPEVVTQTRYILAGVQTGDPVVVAPLIGVLIVAILLFIIAGKKKKKKEE